ncbi:MAG TPA: hypothetical protein VD790_09770 [Thermoleophilaceae bacterium]|nr:hypothetical protein [Thermoleophilaceae bacterium]
MPVRLARRVASAIVPIALIVGPGPVATAAASAPDGTYSYENTNSSGVSGKSTVTIGGQGTTISIRETFFALDPDPTDYECDTTSINFGTQQLKELGGGMLEWSSATKRSSVPPIQKHGANGGTAYTTGSLNPNTGQISLTNHVETKNASGGEGCYETHNFAGKLEPWPQLDVSLRSGDLPGENDLFFVRLEVENRSATPITDIVPTGPAGLVAVPGVFAEEDRGEVALYLDTGESFPATLEAGASFVRTFVFLSMVPGKVLLQAEVTGKNGGGEAVRDAEYAEVGIAPSEGEGANVFEQMGAIEAYATRSFNTLIDASRKWARKRLKRMQGLSESVRKRWLGSAKGAPKIRLLDRAMARMHGMSPEEFATAVPRGEVVRKGGERKIEAAERAVRNAGSGKQETKARRHLKEVRSIQTLSTTESMALYNKARIETDNNEAYKIYEDFGEKPAKGLWQAGGGTLRYLLQFGSYEGRMQIEADMVAMAEANDQSFAESWWAWDNPGEAYTLATGQFEENIEQMTVRRANRERIHRDLYATDPEKAIFLKAQNDSWYAAQVARGFIEAFAPAPGAKLLDKPISWGGKAATSKASRASVMAAEASKSGNAAAGGRIMHGAEDLGEGVIHADDFTFPSADPDELIRLDQLGKKGGAGMRDQRIAEQINREVTDQLRKEFPQADVEFNMSYKRKKDYDPIGSLAKPQAFSEKILDPRSIQVLGAPAEGMGKQVLFRPDHPSKVPGWKQLPAIEKQADLELYDHHLDQWTNFHKRNPAGKTADWKKAIGRRHKIEFGDGHTVELDLELHKLGDDAFEVQAKYMAIDGTLIHNGKPRSIGSDWDPLVGVNIKNGGKKLEGEIERRALQIWNQKAVKAQKELGFRSGGHGATMHGDDVTPEQWAKFAKLAGVHLSPEEQPIFEALVVKRAGLPAGTKIFPATLAANEHLVRTTLSDTYVGPLGQIFD